LISSAFILQDVFQLLFSYIESIDLDLKIFPNVNGQDSSS